MTILHKMKLDEASILEFNFQVFGTADKSSDIRFVIEGPDYSVLCKSKEKDGTVSVQIPKMKGIIPAGTYSAKLECIIDGKLFTPLNEEVEFEPLIEIEIGKKKNKEPVQEEVKVSVKAIHVKTIEEEVQETPIEQEVIEEAKVASVPLTNHEKAILEGFDIVKINDFEVLKKDDLYYGFVSEGAYLKSDVGHNTLTSLMESM